MKPIILLAGPVGAGKTTAAAMTYALYGYETILDFPIPPWFLETASRIVDKKDVPLDYVVLYPAETICMARAASRREGTISDYRPYHELYADFREAGRRHLVSASVTDFRHR